MSDVATPSPHPSTTPIGAMTGQDMVLYAMMVMVWGTSWIAMANQVDIVPPIITGIYRFTLAGAMTFVWTLWSGHPLRFPWRVHLRLAILGVLMFSTNFVLFYYCARYLPSGLLAVIFSLTSLFNIVLSALFLRHRPTATGILGAILGFAGIGLIFWPEIAQNAGKDGVLIGLAFGLCGTLFFASGNMMSVAIRKYEVPLLSANVWAMFYGTLWLICLAVILGEPFLIDTSAKYWIAMAWLVIMASVIAFWGYMTLLKNIGPARAGYLTVLFPIVALVISTIFEDYRWSLPGLLGLTAIIAGNILVMQKRKTRA